MSSMLAEVLTRLGPVTARPPTPFVSDRPRRAIGYVRDNSVLTPDQQEEAIRAWASETGMILDRVCRDPDVTTPDIKRPVIQEILASLRHGEIFVACSFSQLTEDPVDVSRLSDKAREGYVQFVFLDGQDELLSPEGEFASALKLLVQRYHRAVGR